MGKLKEIFESSVSIESYSKEYFRYLHAILQKIDSKSLSAIVDVFLNAKKNNKSILFMGNGGSASTASHFAADLCKNAMPKSKSKFKTISLVDNAAITTALSNDIGYENVFVYQLSSLMEKGDVVVGISASGNSENIMKAIRYANLNGGVTIGIAGFDGGRLKKEAKYYVHFPSYKDEYGPVEDAHLVLNHVIISYLCFAEEKSQSKK